MAIRHSTPADSSFSPAGKAAWDAGHTGDASDLSFTPSGTGATSRTVQARMRDWVSVKDFGAVGDGTTDDTTAVQNALNYMVTARGTLYFPTGRYYISGSLEINAAATLIDGSTQTEGTELYNAITDEVGITLRGDGSAASCLTQNHATKTLLFIGNGFNLVKLEGMGFTGRGTTTTGTLIEVHRPKTTIIDCMVCGTAGKGILQNAERLFILRSKIYSCRQSIVQTGIIATNETYFVDLDVESSGSTRDPVAGTTEYSYNINATAGVFPAVAQALLQETRASVTLVNTVNFAWIGGSLKPMQNQAGLKVIDGEAIRIGNLYFEGFVSPAPNPSVIVGGANEQTTVSVTTTAVATTISLTDAQWFRGVIGHINYAGDPGSNTYKMVICPPDFISGSGAASSLGGGIVKGDFEILSSKGVVNNVLQVRTRALSGTAKAWPAGALVFESEGTVKTSADPVVIENCHLEAQQGLGSYTLTVDATTGKTGGQIILGFTRDIYHTAYSGGRERGIVLIGNNRARSVSTYSDLVEVHEVGSISEYPNYQVDYTSDTAWVTAPTAAGLFKFGTFSVQPANYGGSYGVYGVNGARGTVYWVSGGTYTFRPWYGGNGTAAAPAFSFLASKNTGWFFNGSNTMHATVLGTSAFGITAGGPWCLTDASTISMGAGIDIVLARDAAGTLALKNGNNDQKFRSYGTNGGYWERGSATELLTIAAAATTDTTGNLLPANSIIEAVTVRVTTVIPTAATFTVGDATIAARFATGVGVAATTTAIGLTHSDQTGTSGPKQTAAAKVRITPNLTPGAATGVVRITVFYRTFVAPTS